jgi:hypothetical protein
LLAATEVMIVTCESNPAEVEELCRCCAKCEQVDAVKWRALLGHCRRSRRPAPSPRRRWCGSAVYIGPRFTPHVRHRQSLSIIGTDHRVRADGRSCPPSGADTEDFAGEIEHASAAVVEGHLRRDFS